MEGDNKAASTPTEKPAEEDPLNSLFSGILAPGSSLHPTFLLVLDGALATLLVVLLGLFVITNYNPHLLFLSFIELCLWASIKWFVSELQNVRAKEGDSQPAKAGSKLKDE